MCCGISNLKLPLHSDMKYISLLLEVLNEEVYIAVTINLFKAMLISCLLAHSKHACDFERNQDLIYELHS
jgi:hypothetical protein